MKKSLAKFLALVMLLTPLMSVVAPIAGAADPLGSALALGGGSSVETTATVPPAPEFSTQNQGGANAAAAMAATSDEITTTAANLSDLQVGTTYLVNLMPTTTANTGAPSNSIRPLYYPQAVVEVRADGNYVSFFHSNTPMIAGFSATPARVHSYQYDTQQAQTAAAALTNLTDAVREEMNADDSVKVITVKWSDLNLPLYVHINSVVGHMGSGLTGAPLGVFMTLELDTATVMADNPFPEFGEFGQGDGPGQPQETVNKAALQTLINRAAQARQADFTVLSFNAMTTALGEARRVLADPAASQITVNRVHDTLLQAFNGLVRRPTSGNVVNVNNITDGRYTVRVDFWHASQNTPSMANDSLNKTAIIDVSGDRMTMSVSTRPIRVGTIVTHLNNLSVNGRSANVLTRNLAGGRPSAFSFPLPNRNAFQPVAFWLDPQTPPVPAGRLDGRLRISWDTLQRADAGTRLSANIAVVEATIEDPD
ncbi:MAG: NEAT domain-containing protein, partial [Coriobacteriia bacterium]|nr:NEAT domain-containing protein [Coriobacteriia bacterium]